MHEIMAALLNKTPNLRIKITRMDKTTCCTFAFKHINCKNNYYINVALLISTRNSLTQHEFS